MDIITPESKALNRIEFDRLSEELTNQGIVISKIKADIIAMNSKFKSMLDIIKFFPDKVTNLIKELYDTQVQAFLHSCYMYVNMANSEGVPFIMPVTPTSKISEVKVTVSFPHYTTTVSLFCMNHITVDIENWDLFFGANALTFLNSQELTTQYSVVTEEPEVYFSMDEFVSGCTHELEKLLYFELEICKMEQQINQGLRYISELKNMGLYN